MNALTQTMLVRVTCNGRLIDKDFSDTLVARERKQSYRTSRQDGSTTPETLDEKIARVKREMEEIRMEMTNKGSEANSAEVEEWDKMIHSFHGEENATSLLTERVKKLPPPSSTASTPSVVLSKGIC
jgi:hypothetical protein